MLNNDTLLRAILSVTARQAFPPDRLIEILGPGEKQIKAFNLCDGAKTQGEIAKQLKIDKGSFSRTVSRWCEEGILFRLGEGRDATLLHVYPLTNEATKKKGKIK